MSEVLDIKLTTTTRSGTRVRSPARIKYVDDRIEFIKSPFSLKDEIKSMAGSRWHGFDEKPRRIWSVKDCQRNRFQLSYLMGEDVYEWFDQDLIQHKYRQYQLKGVDTDPMPHQFEMADSGLTYHYQIWGAEMGTGKTLAAQMVLEHSGVDWWYWIGPARSLPNMEREFRLWGFDESIRVDFMSYERLKRVMDEWKEGDPLPQGVIMDESSRCKTASSQRSQACQMLGDLIRQKYQFEGYVIEMSGTPSPKKPTDWWSQAEIAWPGFLKEGSVKAMEQRMGFMVQQTFDSGTFWKNIGWKDNELKCDVCGELEEDPCHSRDDFMDEGGDEEYHEFVPSINEVSYLYQRLKGLVIIKHKKDCLNLPDKRYRRVICKPSSSILRVAKALVESSPNAMIGSTLLRELSDGFQYREEADGEIACNHCPEACGIVDEWFDPDDENRTFSAIDMLDEELVAKLEKRGVECPKCNGTGRVTKKRRYAREVPCPKERALRDLLEENDETGRLVIFAGFTGSVDRCCSIAHKEGWSVVRCDGRGYHVTLSDGTVITDVQALDYWADLDNNPRVAFIAHPESGGMSLTLTEARMAVYWSNSFKPEYRTQSEDRIHRKGMDENLGCTIVDLIHLPSDDRVLEVIRENRKLELMTMGEIFPEDMFDATPDEGGTEVTDAH
jgi:SNF2 family DNA or RNA helicase